MFICFHLTIAAAGNLTAWELRGLSGWQRSGVNDECYDFGILIWELETWCVGTFGSCVRGDRRDEGRAELGAMPMLSGKLGMGKVEIRGFQDGICEFEV